MLSDLCERGECENCFEDELDACAHECHGPLDHPAGYSTGAGRVQHRAAMVPPTVAPPVSAVPRGASAGLPVPGTTPGTPGTGTPPPAIPSRDPRRAEALSSPQPSERQAAGIPDPGTGREDPAADLRMPSRPGRGTDPSPARGALEGARGVPAGSTGRTFTIALPAGLKMINLNERLHWSEERRRARDIKDAAIVMARKAGLPRLERVSIVAEYQPPDRRHRDGDNYAKSAKHATDGIVQAGCLPGDDKRYVTGTYCTIGERYPKGRLVLHLTEVAATGGDAA